MKAEEQIYAYKELKKNGQAFFVSTYEDADRIIKALEKQIPKIRYNPDDEQNGHFYLVNGYMTCMETGKDIRYPLSSFGDLDFCPRCGQRLDFSEVDK